MSIVSSSSRVFVRSARRLLALQAVALALGACGSDGTAAVMGGPRMPLSGDVLLPSQAQPGGELVVIDSKSSLLSFVRPATCSATASLPAAGLAIVSSDYSVSSVALYDPATGTLADDCLTSAGDGGRWARAQLSVSTGGFKAHPHDVVGLSDHKAYVTRYETNASPTAAADDFDEGDDLLIVDPAAVSVTGRISLAALATAGPGGTTTQARPDRAVLAEGRVYVTLNNISADFAATGPGRVAVIDPATDQLLDPIDLPNQKDCSGIQYVAAAHRLYVACGGAFSDGAEQLAQSALVEIDISATPPAVGRIVRADALGTQPINFGYAAVAGETAFVGLLGALDPTTGAPLASDAFYSVPLAGGSATKLMDGGAYNLGRSLVDAGTQKVFLPDGDAVNPRVHIWDVASGAAGTAFEANPSGHLPPREVARY